MHRVDATVEFQLQVSFFVEAVNKVVVVQVDVQAGGQLRAVIDICKETLAIRESSLPSTIYQQRSHFLFKKTQLRIFLLLLL